MLKKVLPFIIIADLAVGVLIFSLFNKDLGKVWFLKSSYWLMLLMTLAWVWSVVGSVRMTWTDFRSSLIEHRYAILGLVALTGLVFMTVPWGYRVLADETNMLSVSRSMFWDRTTGNITQGVYKLGAFIVFGGNSAHIEIHPLLFPFFTSLLHSLTGYRPENAIWTNLLAYQAFFTVLYFFLVPSFGKGRAFFTCLLVASHPIFSVSATSAGYDLFYALWILLSLVFLKRFSEDQTKERFTALWMTLVMLANTRHEAAGYLFTAALLIVAAGLMKEDYFEKNAVITITPLLLLPLSWQRFLQSFGNIYQLKPGETAFSWGNFVKNHRMFVEGLERSDFSLPYNNFAIIGGLLVIVYLLATVGLKSRDWRAVNWRAELKRHFYEWTAVTGFVVNWLIVLAYHFGRFAHPTVCRYFLPFLLFFTFFFALGLKRWVKGFPLYLLVCVAFFAVYHPVAIQNRYVHSQVAPMKFEKSLEVIRRVVPKQATIITEKPGLLIPFQYGAINFQTANGKGKRFTTDLQSGLLGPVYAVQDLDTKTLKVRPNNHLSDLYRTEDIETVFVTTQDAIRVLRVYPQKK